jgi:hypothetical protein
MTKQKEEPVAAEIVIHPMEQMLDFAYTEHDGRNTGMGYRFTSEKQVSERIRNGFRQAHLHVKSCEVLNVEHGSYANARGKSQQYCTCQVRIFLEDDVGTVHGPYEGIGSGADFGDKAPMKAMTAARKYAISSCCLFSWGDDPEADPATDAHAEAEADPAPPPELSNDALAAVAEGKKIATKGTKALADFWVKLVSKPVKIELKGREPWEDVKEMAERADAKGKTSGRKQANDGAVQGAEKENKGHAEEGVAGKA